MTLLDRALTGLRTSLMVEYHTTKRVEEQYAALMTGFNELIPQALINVFDEREVEHLIGGIFGSMFPLPSYFLPPRLTHPLLHTVDVDDWAKFTDYRGYSADDQVIKWFWQCIRSWPAERRSRLLQFATGTNRIPVGGFKDLQGPIGLRRFNIEKSGDPSRLPMANAGSNRVGGLDLCGVK